MKRFLTCALCFVSLPAVATVTLWYEQDGACPGLYRSKPATACNATAVSHLTVTPADDTTFTGFFLDNKMLVNANGDITSNALNILLDANLSGPVEIPQTYMCPDGTTETGYGECESSASMITVKLDTRGGSMSKTSQFKAVQGARLSSYVPDRSSFDGAIFAGWAKEGQPDSSASRNAAVNAPAGSTVTYRAVYTCPGDYYMNDYNVCVSDGEDYFDTQGRSVSPDQLQCWRLENGVYVNYCHWKVKITFHNNNQGFSLTSGTQNNNMVLRCYGGRGCDSNSLCATNSSYGKCTHLYVPKANDYWFRGYFWPPKQLEELIVDANDLEHGAYNNFYPKTMMGDTMSITGHAVVVVEPYTPVELSCDGNWVPNTTDPNKYCNGTLVDNVEWPIDVYGGWARKCAQSTTQNPFSCQEVIGTAYYNTEGFYKGLVKYNTSCAAGYTMTGGNNTYYPQCTKESGTLGITYNFVDQYGLAVTGCGVSSATCEVHDTYYLPYQTICGSNNTLKYLETYAGFYTPSHGITCSSNVFGNVEPRTVTGYVCRYSCELGQTVPNGTCVQAYRSGGTVNGNEYVSNIYEGCNAITCRSGYKITLTGNGIECIQQGQSMGLRTGFVVDENLSAAGN